MRVEPRAKLLTLLGRIRDRRAGPALCDLERAVCEDLVHGALLAPAAHVEGEVGLGGITVEHGHKVGELWSKAQALSHKHYRVCRAAAF